MRHAHRQRSSSGGGRKARRTSMSPETVCSEPVLAIEPTTMSPETELTEASPTTESMNTSPETDLTLALPFDDLEPDIAGRAAHVDVVEPPGSRNVRRLRRDVERRTVRTRIGPKRRPAAYDDAQLRAPSAPDPQPVHDVDHELRTPAARPRSTIASSTAFFALPARPRARSLPRKRLLSLTSTVPAAPRTTSSTGPGSVKDSCLIAAIRGCRGGS